MVAGAYLRLMGYGFDPRSTGVEGVAERPSTCCASACAFTTTEEDWTKASLRHCWPRLPWFVAIEQGLRSCQSSSVVALLLRRVIKKPTADRSAVGSVSDPRTRSECRPSSSPFAPGDPRRSRVEWGFKKSVDALCPSGCCAAVPIIVLVSTNHCAITVIEALFNSLSVQQDVGFKANMLRRMHCDPGSSRLEKACQPRPPRARNRHGRTRSPASPPHPQAKPH